MNSPEQNRQDSEGSKWDVLTEYAEKREKQAELQRRINEKLVTIDDLEAAIAAGNPEVERGEPIEYDGKTIPVYTLKGYPCSLISHAVDFKMSIYKSSGGGGIGVKTMLDLLENPSIWTQTESEAKAAHEFGTEDGSAMSTTISASYVNTEGSLYYRAGYDSEIRYGFSQLEGDSVICLRYNDNLTRVAKTRLPSEVDDDDFRVFDGINSGKRGGSLHNEIVLQRYDEQGNPRLPDYIITDNMYITETTKKHAAYFGTEGFGIPIINIDRESYRKKALEIIDNKLECITDDASYREIVLAIDKIKQYSVNAGIGFWILCDSGTGTVGTGRDAQEISTLRHFYNNDERSKKCIDAAEIEFKKRFEFVREELARCIDEIKKANEQRTSYKYKSDFLKRFEVGEVKKANWDGNEMNYFDVHIVSNGCMEEIETTVLDGKHTEDPGYYDGAPSLKERDKNSSSDIYCALVPLVREYHKLMNENQHIAYENQLRGKS